MLAVSIDKQGLKYMSDKIYSDPNPEVPNTSLGWSDTYHKKFILSLVSDEVRQQRIEICESCDKFKLYFCIKCNCYMPFKTRIESATCPVNKW